MEQLKAQLDERDKTIQHLQKDIERPPPIKHEISKKNKKLDRDFVSLKIFLRL